MPAEERVTRESIPRAVLPIVKPAPVTLLPQRRWSDADWQRIEAGHCAGSMDDKWDVFIEGNVAFLHRSWTGYGIYEATFEAAEDGWRISSAVVESDPERHRRQSDERDCVMIEVVISAIMLGEPDPGLRSRFTALTQRDDEHPQT